MIQSFNTFSLTLQTIIFSLKRITRGLLYIINYKVYLT